MNPILNDAAAELLADKDTSAFVLVSICLCTFPDDEFFTLRPPVIFSELEKKYSCKLPDENENKINAALTVFHTDLFQRSEHVFRSVAAAFDSGDIDDTLDGKEEELSAPAALWAITEAGEITGKDIEPDDLSRPVAKYVNKLISSEAEDNSEIPDDVDTMEEALEVPWVQRFINMRVKDICKDLRKLGLPEDKIVEMEQKYQ